MKCAGNEYMCTLASASWLCLTVLLPLHLFTLQIFRINQFLFNFLFPTLGQLFSSSSSTHYLPHCTSVTSLLITVHRATHTLSPVSPLFSVSPSLPSCCVPANPPLEPGHEADGQTFVERVRCLNKITGHLNLY